MNTTAVDTQKASQHHRAAQLRKEIATLRIKRGDYETIGEVPIGGSKLVFGGRNFPGAHNAKGWVAAWYAGEPLRVVDMVEFSGDEAIEDSESPDFVTDAESERADENIQAEIEDFIAATAAFEIEDVIRTAKRYAELLDPEKWWDEPKPKPALPSPAPVAAPQDVA